MIHSRMVFDETLEIDERIAKLWIVSERVPNTYYWRIKTKLAGVTFPSVAFFSAKTRRKVINGVVANLTDKTIAILSKDYSPSKFDKSMVRHRVGRVNRFLKLKREPDNKYDPNAITALVNSSRADLTDVSGSVSVVPKRIDVGYIPSQIAGMIVRQNLDFYLVGVSFPSKGNFLLDILLSERSVSKNVGVKERRVVKGSKEWSEKVEEIGFVSLNKMRKLLEG